MAESPPRSASVGEGAGCDHCLSLTLADTVFTALVRAEVMPEHFPMLLA